MTLANWHTSKLLFPHHKGKGAHNKHADLLGQWLHGRGGKDCLVSA